MLEHNVHGVARLELVRFRLTEIGAALKRRERIHISVLILYAYAHGVLGKYSVVAAYSLKRYVNARLNVAFESKRYGYERVEACGKPIFLYFRSVFRKRVAVVLSNGFKLVMLFVFAVLEMIIGYAVLPAALTFEAVRARSAV